MLMAGPDVIRDNRIAITWFQRRQQYFRETDPDPRTRVGDKTYLHEDRHGALIRNSREPMIPCWDVATAKYCNIPDQQLSP